MNDPGFIANLLDNLHLHPYLRVVLETPLVPQLMLVALVLLVLWLWPSRLSRRQRAGEIVYRFEKLEVRIDPAADSPVIGLRRGWRRFSALALNPQCARSDWTTTHAETETSTGMTSGGMTSDGRYVMPQTVVLTRYTGRTFDIRRGTNIDLSFWVSTRKGMQRRSFHFRLRDGRLKKFDTLWQQFQQDIAALEQRVLSHLP
jgi:hypothetical protein